MAKSFRIQVHLTFSCGAGANIPMVIAQVHHKRHKIDGKLDARTRDGKIDARTAEGTHNCQADTVIAPYKKKEPEASILVHVHSRVAARAPTTSVIFSIKIIAQ